MSHLKLHDLAFDKRFGTKIVIAFFFLFHKRDSFRRLYQPWLHNMEEASTSFAALPLKLPPQPQGPVPVHIVDIPNVKHILIKWKHIQTIKCLTFRFRITGASVGTERISGI